MGKIPLKQWDCAVHLKTEEDLAQYLDACLQEADSDAAFLAGAPGHRGLGVDGICGCFGHGFAAVVLGCEPNASD